MNHVFVQIQLRHYHASQIQVQTHDLQIMDTTFDVPERLASTTEPSGAYVKKYTATFSERFEVNMHSLANVWSL